MSRAKTFESAPQDVERPLLQDDDGAFDDLERETGNAPDALAKLAAARERGRLAHAVLLAGPAGCGKRWVAARLAQLLSCATPQDGRPCLRCAECMRTDRGLDTDVMVVEPPWDDKKGERKNEIPVELVRKAQEILSFRAAGRRRVVIVDPADRLSIIAQEALLKTLEEPPQGVTLLLLTSRASFLKPTIRSRAPLLRIAPSSRAALARVVQKRKQLAPDQAELVARLSGGDLRAALQLDPAETSERWLACARAVYELLGPKGERKARDLALAIAPSKGEEGGGGRSEMLASLTLLERVLRDAMIAGAGGAEDASQLLNPSAEKAARGIAQRLHADAAARALALVEAARDHVALNMNAKVLLTHLFLQLHELRAA